jgi:hypothetical protein
MAGSNISLVTGELRYVLSEISFKKVGVLTDPTGDVVRWAFPLQGTALSAATWYVCSWETVGTTYWARCLVGTTGTAGGDVTLAAGAYDAYVKITDNPEAPIEYVGRVTVR